MELNKPTLSCDYLTKPATVLIEKISDAIGIIFEPYQTKRMAFAIAETEIIKAENEIRINEIKNRASQRLISEEYIKQNNIENITAKAIEYLNENSCPQDIDRDWIANFFEKSKIVSNVEMQNVWAKVLAGEANNPGTFSKKTVNIINDIERYDAQNFTTLCGFKWIINDVPKLLILDIHHDIYAGSNISVEVLTNLENIGLIKFLPTYYSVESMHGQILANYYGRELKLSLNRKASQYLLLGYVVFTKAGEELSTICDSTPVNGFFDLVFNRWDRRNLLSINTPSRLKRFIRNNFIMPKDLE